MIAPPRPSPRKKVLFVGGRAAFWQELRAQAGRPDRPWDASFAGGGTEALVSLSISAADAVVVDLQLPDFDGAQLLDEVMRRHPGTLRFLSADLTDGQAALRCLGRAHQYLMKPTDMQTVEHALQRAFALELWLPNEGVQGLISQMRKLPSPPAVYFKVVKALQSVDTSLEEVGSLIAQDMVLTAKLLQLVNSAVFGVRTRVSNAAEAVIYLGLDQTKSLVLLAHTFSYFERAKAVQYSVDELWRHSLATGQAAQRIAQVEGAEAATVGEAFTAGMLHDLGKLILAANLPELFGQALARARQTQQSLWEIESELLGATHPDLGASLLSIWGLPVPIVEAVALHHLPARLYSKSFCPLTAVHAANALEHETRPNPGEGAAPTLDLAYLAELALTERVNEWRAACRRLDEGK